eukprot:COSAG06_NODE_658_length_13322_cov_3.396430_10_plen_114_part_00
MCCRAVVVDGGACVPALPLLPFVAALDWDGPLEIDGTDQFVSFKLHDNKAFPQGMHEALATMEPGERVRLVLKSAKAYGGEDSPLAPLRLDAIKEPLQFEVSRQAEMDGWIDR